VAAFAVIKGLDVIKDGECGSLSGLEALVPWKDVGFNGRKDAFGESIVVAITFGTHTLSKAEDLKTASCFGCGILAAPIRVKDGSPMNHPSFEGILEGCGNNFSVERVGEAPSQNTSGEEVQNDAQIDPAFRGADISDIADDVLPGCGGSRSLSQQVGRRPGGGILDGGFGTKTTPSRWVNGVDTHESGHSFLGTAEAQFLKFGGHARASVGSSVPVGVYRFNGF